MPYKGSAVNVVRQLVGGLRSGLSYCGASNLLELRNNGEFIKITEVGLKESMPHDVKDSSERSRHYSSSLFATPYSDTSQK